MCPTQEREGKSFYNRGLWLKLRSFLLIAFGSEDFKLDPGKAEGLSFNKVIAETFTPVLQYLP